MSYIALVINVMIASPSDVEKERRIIREEIYQWNAAHSIGNEIILNPIGWETDSIPYVGAHPQTTINEQICNLADFAIVAFHSRLGTPTPNAIAGTAEEIDYLRSQGKEVLIYVSKKPLANTTDAQQLSKLRAYLEELREKALIEFYDSDEKFRGVLQRHLSQHSRKLKSQSLPGKIMDHLSERVSGENTEFKLDDYEKFVLFTAANNSQGTVAFRKSQNGAVFCGNTISNARKSAAIRHAFDRLIGLGFLDNTSEFAFQITQKGFNYYDDHSESESWKDSRPSLF